jgi:hypothetical protein
VLPLYETGAQIAKSLRLFGEKALPKLAHIRAPKEPVPSGDALTPERMLELCNRHEQFEFAGDLEGIMSTLVEHPRYELFPRGVRITGTDAVRVFYERLLPIFRGLDPAGKDVPTREVVSIAFGEHHLAAELVDVFDLPDGTRRRLQSSAVVEFCGDLLLGERLYLDSALGALFEATLGEDFFARPDVSIV